MPRCVPSCVPSCLVHVPGDISHRLSCRSGALLGVLDWFCCMTEPRHANAIGDPARQLETDSVRYRNVTVGTNYISLLENVVNLLGLSSAACRDAAKSAAQCYEQCAHRKQQMKTYVDARLMGLLNRLLLGLMWLTAWPGVYECSDFHCSRCICTLHMVYTMMHNAYIMHCWLHTDCF